MKKLLMIGGGFLQDFVIRRAVDMGIEVLNLDADPKAVGFTHAHRHAVIDIVDEKACLEYAQREKIDGVMTAATDYGVLSSAYIAARMGLPGIDYEAARLIKNKYRTRRTLMDHRVDDMPQAREVSTDTDIEALGAELIYPVMVKPCDGSGSRGAGRVDRPEDLRKACETAMGGSLIGRAEVESFITGQEYGAESFVADGEIHVLGIMKKWITKAPYYAELGHAIPCGLPPATEERARDCVAKAIRALGIDFGCVNMDMLITSDGRITIVDIGARMGGNMIGPCVIPYGTGIDYVGAAIRAALGEKPDMTARGHGGVITKFLAFDSEGTVRRLPDMDAVGREFGVEIYHHLAAGQKVRPYHTNLDGCGYLVARAEDLTEGRARLDAAYARIVKEAF